MRSVVYQLVTRLAEPGSGLSRNRHFALFASPAGRRALRIRRHLASLARDYRKHGAEAALDVRELGAGAVEVRLEIPSLKLVRTARLLAEDVEVLRADAEPLAARLPTPST